MTEDRFTELTNLYLDKEISEKQLVELKAELAVNSQRQAEFQERCRLHQAMRLALDSDSSQGRRTTSRSPLKAGRRSGERSGGRSGGRSDRERQGSGRRASSRVPPVSGARVNKARVNKAREGTRPPVGFPRWVLGLGLMASAVMAFLFLSSVFREHTQVAALPQFEGADTEDLSPGDPLDAIGRTDLRRFATIQEQRTFNQRASLAAQLRLMGLRPEMTPQEKELRSVSLDALQPKVLRHSRSAMLQPLQSFSPMPAPQILRKVPGVVEPLPKWPGGFQSSLASFK